ncbi:MAG: AraC family transcriptional regulator [Clostridiales bacterium]|nr:AraC family transcriptional regulator [Clostridiales bacterium]
MYYQTINANIAKHHDLTYFENFRFDRHLHQDFELVIPTFGEIRVMTEDRSEILTPGSCALILSDQMHAYDTVGSSGTFVHVFSPDTVGSFAKEIAGKSGTTSVFPVPNVLTNRYLDAIAVRKDYREYTLKGFLYLFLAEYLSHTKLVSRRATQSSLLSSMFAYIHAHFREKITLEDIAENCGYDAHYLSRIFATNVGINFRRVVNSYRLDYARALLEESDLSITEIAMASGFGSVRSFNRAFAEEYDESPRHGRGSGPLKDSVYILGVYETPERR